MYARSTSQPSRDGWMAMVRKHHAWKTYQFPNLCFHGEDIYGIHSIKYDAICEDQTYYLFAIRDGDTFLAWDEVVRYAELLGVPTVPVVFRGVFDTQTELTKFMQDERKKPSFLGPEREGFVIRHPNAFATNEFEQNVVKYVRANHVQTTTHWRRNWQPCQLKK
ncbi:MAG: RNA ligase family protein [Richelia sp. RM2_1_2]|nr:RNA ligase family protein [Richelia sp. RM2_1_2]